MRPFILVSGPDGASWASWEETARKGGKFPQRHPSEAGQDGLPGDRMGGQDGKPGEEATLELGFCEGSGEPFLFF